MSTVLIPKVIREKHFADQLQPGRSLARSYSTKLLERAVVGLASVPKLFITECQTINHRFDGFKITGCTA